MAQPRRSSALYAPQEQAVELAFTQGLMEGFEVSTVPAGYAAKLQNWVPEATGVLRARVGWQTAGSAGVGFPRRSRGFGYFVTPGGVKSYVGAAVSPLLAGSSYDIASIDRTNLNAGWTAIETVAVADSSRLVAFAAGAGKLLFSTPDFPFIRTWDGATSADASADAIAGRALCYHTNRFFSGGDLAQPTWLRFSELGDAATWNVTTNYLPVGQDDGEPIEDIVDFDRGLIVGKENSLWFLSGSGPDDFALHRLDGGGVAPGRTLVTTPSGVVAIGRHQVWFYQGAGAEPISFPIQQTYGMTGDFMTGAYIDGDVYVCDEGSGRIWVFDLGSSAWRSEIYDITDEGPGLVFANADQLLAGPKAANNNSLALYRVYPAPTRDRDHGASETYVARSGQHWFGGPDSPATLMHLYLQLRQRGGDATESPITVTLYMNGADVPTAQKTISPQPLAPGVYRARIDFGSLTGWSIQVEIAQTVLVDETDVFDIEAVTAYVSVEHRR